MVFQIPTVTIVSSSLVCSILRDGSLLSFQDDLRAFHLKHFPQAAEPETFLHGVHADAAEEDYYDEEEDLGFYDDGVKRTLTDGTIALFRNTEIQEILRQRDSKLQDREQGEHMDENPTATLQSSQAATNKPASSDLSLSADAALHKPAAKTVNDALGRVSAGRVEKPKAPQWATSSARTKAKNRRHRDKYRAKKKKLEKEQVMRHSRPEGDDESDEWDPWHQANGPDAQKEDPLDLDY